MDCGINDMRKKGMNVEMKNKKDVKHKDLEEGREKRMLYI